MLESKSTCTNDCHFKELIKFFYKLFQITELSKSMPLNKKKRTVKQVRKKIRTLNCQK